MYIKNLFNFINEALIKESFAVITSEKQPEFEDFVKYLIKYSKSLKISKSEQQRYKKNDSPITKDIAQNLLSKRLYNNVNAMYKIEPEFFLEICKKNSITVNMSNLGFGKDEVIKWNSDNKNIKIDHKNLYFDDDCLVLFDKTIGYKNIDLQKREVIDDGIKLLPEYENRAEEILTALKKKFKYHNWYIIKK